MCVSLESGSVEGGSCHRPSRREENLVAGPCLESRRHSVRCVIRRVDRRFLPCVHALAREPVPGQFFRSYFFSTISLAYRALAQPISISWFAILFLGICFLPTVSFNQFFESCLMQKI